MNATTAARQHVQAPSPPPTAHTIKPHHIHLLWALWILHRDYTELRELPKAFVLTMYRILLVEVAEVRQPPTYAQLMHAFKDAARYAITPIAILILERIRDPERELFDTPTHIHDWFIHLEDQFQRDDDDDEPGRFARRSLFGYFMRRCYVSCKKLSLEATNLLCRDYRLWLAGKLDSETVSVRRGLLTNEYNLFKTEADKKEYATSADYAFWEYALAVGDEAVASEHLRTFFEQHFHEGNDSGLRQHALLSLARMHYIRHEYVACRKLLEEAITTSRTCNDKQTLQHCIGLINRLPSTDKTRRPPINDVQPDLHPWEVLADVKKLMTITHQQPLSASFEKIAQAAILYDMWSDAHKHAVTEAEQWGQNSVQAVAWSMLGNMQLAEVEDTIVIAFTDENSDDNTRLVSHLNRASRHARRGKYTDAIAMLLDPSVWSGLTIADCQLWANEIWHILVLRASRRGQERMYHEYLLPQKPPGQYNAREYWFGSNTPLGSHIRDPLYEVISAREVKQAQGAIEPLLTSLWHSEFQQRFIMYRAGLVLLADVGLQFGLTRWSRRILEEVMPQLITGDDLEQRGFACFTLARCILAAEEPTPETLREALYYLKLAVQDYEALEMFKALQDTLFLVSVLYHNLGLETERDTAAQQYHDLTKQRTEVETTVSEPWIPEVLQTVAEISTALAAR